MSRIIHIALFVLEKILLAYFLQYVSVINGMLFVLAHYDKITVWYLMENLVIREMERLHECGDLPQ